MTPSADPAPVPGSAESSGPTPAATPEQRTLALLSRHSIEHGPTPKHAQLKSILTEVCHEDLRPGDALPSERILEEVFGVSRITVRRAIGDMVRDGTVESFRGKGTFVAHRPLRSDLHLASFTAEMKQKGAEPSAMILVSEVAEPPESVAEFLGDGRQIHLTRVRLGDGLPYSVDDAWYSADLAPDLLDRAVHKSVYSILTSEYDLPIDEAEQTCTAAAATADVGRALGLGIGDPVLRIRRMAFSRGRPVEVCTSTYRPDRYTLRMHLRDTG
ncbi:GntR family transcriptional regulator [uncultured Corynebacterium sp.]|uniref:GntR family transcriptional regulator n=1 Tax=uncultured Corynebacterium sp. TaxID=159447 RepID=UPI0025E2AC3B|nr:GntR family transcriptional regulator [uncultured Corynebacterium sp.]